MRGRIMVVWLTLVSGTAIWMWRDASLVRRSPSPGSVPAPAEIVVEPLLRLVGVVAPQEGEPLAVIEDLRTRKLDFYLTGDVLPRGVTLRRIASDEVVLGQADGAEVTLGLQGPHGTPAPQGITGLRVTRFADTTTTLIETAQITPSNASFRSGRPRRALTHGGVRGFGIRGTAFETVLAALELQDGDVLLAVDERPLAGFRKASTILDEALRAPPVTVTVFKRRENQTLTYFLGRVAEPVRPEAPTPRVPAGPSAGLSEAFTGRLLMLGMVAGHVPRTMDVEVRATDSATPILIEIRPCLDPRGAFKGLEISQARPLQEIERVGLQVGDIITAVNGIHLRSLLQTLGAVRRALKASSVDVELSRGDDTFIRTFER